APVIVITIRDGGAFAYRGPRFARSSLLVSSETSACSEAARVVRRLRRCDRREPEFVADTWALPSCWDATRCGAIRKRPRVGVPMTKHLKTPNSETAPDSWNRARVTDPDFG